MVSTEYSILSFPSGLIGDPDSQVGGTNIVSTLSEASLDTSGRTSIASLRYKACFDHSLFFNTFVVADDLLV